MSVQRRIGRATHEELSAALAISGATSGLRATSDGTSARAVIPGMIAAVATTGPSATSPPIVAAVPHGTVVESENGRLARAAVGDATTSSACRAPRGKDANGRRAGSG